MKILLFIFASVLGVYAEDSPRVIRVVTWNLQWFPTGGRKSVTKEQQTTQIEKIREEIRKLRPDILLLQEISSGAVILETLKPLGDDWSVAVVSQFKDGNFISGQQLVIAARFQSDTAWAESWARGWAGAPRGYAYASFLIGKKRLAIYNLHLKSNLGASQENTSKREDAAEQLVAHTLEKDRVPAADAILIGGDFNSDDSNSPGGLSPSERTFGILKNAGFSWSYEGIAHKDRISCPGKGGYPPACFDHFFTKGLNNPLASVHMAVGSDHLPVVIDIVF